MSLEHIYLDHNASTPVAPEVLDAMLPHLTRSFGNPSSSHWASANAAHALATARENVARLIGANAEDLVFTSGGSESNNWAIKGVVARALREGAVESPHVVISAVEHPAVIEPCRYLGAFGVRTSVVPVDGHGRVAPDDVENVIEPDTVLISIMHANNEVGTIQPIREICAVAHERGVPVHCDAAQSVGKIRVDVDELGVDLLSVAGHKMYAPKGVGALYVRPDTQLDPLIHGGGHELGRRAGTENVAFAVALGAAAQLATQSLLEAETRELSEHFLERLRAAFGNRVKLLGHHEHRLPNTVNVAFTGESGIAILSRVPAVAASTGSACHTGETKMSPVLAAMSTSEVDAAGAIRFSLGRNTTREELDRVVDLLEAVR